MKQYLLFIFLLISNAIFSQSYRQMLDHDSEWHLTSCFSGCLNDVYYTDGDTLYNGYQYKILNGFHYISRSFWLREDVTAKQVFLSTLVDKNRTEALLYDFSLQVGDSIDIKNPISPFPESPGYFSIDSIVNVQLVDGLIYRQFYLSPNASSASTEMPIWIEGIGSLSLINAPGGTPDVNGSGKVSCHFNLGSIIYSELDSLGACIPNYVASVPKINSSNIQVYPTLCHDYLSITSAIKVDQISIYNINGSLVYQNNSKTMDLHQIDIQQLSQGMYFVSVFTEEHQSVFKIVKE